MNIVVLFERIDPAVVERVRRSEIEFRADPEGAHGRVVSSENWHRTHDMPLPKVDTTVNLKALLESRAIATQVEKQIVTNNRTVNDSSGFDGQAGPVYPDHGFH